MRNSYTVPRTLLIQNDKCRVDAGPHDPQSEENENKMVTLSDFLVKDAIRCNLVANSKADAISQLIFALVEANAIPSNDPSILASAIDREELGSTAIGGGVALPRAKCAELAHPVSTIGTFPVGLDFESLDRRPVYIVFLSVSDQSGPHIKMLGEIASFVQDDMMRKHLASATSAATLADLVEEWTSRTVAAV